VSAGLDAYNPSALVATITQGGTLLPERRYYLASDATIQAVRQEYHAYLTRMFTLAERADPSGDADAVVALETVLARAQMAGPDARNSAARAFELSALGREMPGFEWREWARPQGLDLVASIILEQPEFFREFARAAQEVPLRNWRAWLAARYLTASSVYLSRAFGDARFEFFGRIMSGQETPRVRWKRAVSMVNGHLGDAVGQLYVRKHLPDGTRDRVVRIVRRIVDAFRQAIDEATWMTPAARREARNKLNRLQAGVGYPDRWRRYDALRIDPDDLLGNVQRAQAFANAYQMARLRRSQEPRQWLMPPQTVNAYYTPSRNEIILPAAMLQPPLYDPAVEDAANYGAIGAMIGHEISHAFDTRGRRFDAYGRIADWWTLADEREFQARARLLIEQFNQYSPFPGHAVSGQLTLGENFADLAGLAVAVRAYRLSLDGRPSPEIDGFSGEQRLFIKWAQTWRERVRDEYLKQTLLFSPHAPSQYRTHGAATNLDAFHEAFAVGPGDRLYRDPKKRVRIW
jgi:putative endopeptidase